jgi:hypothetical protein
MIILKQRSINRIEIQNDSAAEETQEWRNLVNTDVRVPLGTGPVGGIVEIGGQ